jgi:flagellar assembly factor FliW
MISVAHEDPSALEPSIRSVSSLVLGELDVSAEVVMAFPTPLFGFPNHAEYALLPAAREGLWWLQSMSDEAVTFLLADPFVLDAGYGVDLGETERAALHIEQPSDAFGLVMLTLPAEATDSATANFRAPIVFNLGRRLGRQVVNREDGHDLRRAVSLEVFPAQTSGVRIQ